MIQVAQKLSEDIKESMLTIKQYIATLKSQLNQHSFFTQLTQQRELSRALSFAPSAAFWVLAFQDMLRLNAQRAKNPEIKRLLEQHVSEDAGHEEWYFEDLKALYGDLFVRPKDLFSAHSLDARGTAFSIVSEMFRIEDDYLRLVFVEVLEATAQVFFENVSVYLRASGNYQKLKYFGAIHQQAESEHEMFEGHIKQQTQAYIFTTSQQEEARDLVERTFLHFEVLFTQFEERLNAPLPKPPNFIEKHPE
jgi:hypothetical protein